MSDMLKRQDRENGRNRQWRNNFKRLQKELVQLEEDELALDAVFPQVSNWSLGNGWINCRHVGGGKYSSERCSTLEEHCKHNDGSALGHGKHCWFALVVLRRSVVMRLACHTLSTSFFVQPLVSSSC
jgi:hypothetical protein